MDHDVTNQEINMLKGFNPGQTQWLTQIQKVEKGFYAWELSTFTTFLG